MDRTDAVSPSVAKRQARLERRMAALADREQMSALTPAPERFRVATWNVRGGFENEHLDREPRLISALIDTPQPIRVTSVYVPHGRTVDHWHFEYKLAFLDSLAARVAAWVTQGHLIVAGDVNWRRPTATCSIPTPSSG